MERLENTAVQYGIAADNVYSMIVHGYKNKNPEAIALVENFFERINKDHLLHPNVGRNSKPQMRIFSAVNTEMTADLMHNFDTHDIVASQAWTSKETYLKALVECCYHFATDYCRKQSKQFLTIGSEFRSKVFNNYDIHICCDAQSSHSWNDISEQLSYLKTIKKPPPEEVLIRRGLSEFFKDGKLNSERMCTNVSECKAQVDTLLINHIEEYITIEQVALSMLQHGAFRAVGFFLFPDGVNYERSGTFSNGRFFFQKFFTKFLDVEDPIVFYSENNVLQQAVYPQVDYEDQF